MGLVYIQGNPKEAHYFGGSLKKKKHAQVAEHFWIVQSSDEDNSIIPRPVEKAKESGNFLWKARVYLRAVSMRGLAWISI